MSTYFITYFIIVIIVYFCPYILCVCVDFKGYEGKVQGVVNGDIT